jgi:hypothetical protein
VPPCAPLRLQQSEFSVGAFDNVPAGLEQLCKHVVDVPGGSQGHDTPMRRESIAHHMRFDPLTARGMLERHRAFVRPPSLSVCALQPAPLTALIHQLPLSFDELVARLAD